MSIAKIVRFACRRRRRRRHEKTYVSNDVFFTLLHEWVDRGQTHQLEKLLCV